MKRSGGERERGASERRSGPGGSYRMGDADGPDARGLANPRPPPSPPSALNDECAAITAALWAARSAALRSGDVAGVAAGRFVHPGQRLLAWMGGARPSDYLACARAKFAVWGEDLPPAAAADLADLQAMVGEQQASMAAAFSDLSARLARAAAVAAYVRSACRSPGFGCDGPFWARAAHPSPPPAPAIAAIVDDMRALLMHADELRALCAARVKSGLPPRAAALVWLSVADTVALDARPTPSPTVAAASLARAGSGGLRVRF